MAISIHAYDDERGIEKFAAFDSISDSFIAYDMTRDDFVEWWAERARKDAIWHLEEIDLPQYDKRQSRFIKRDQHTFLECLETHFRIKHCKEKDFNQGLQKLMKRMQNE